MRKRLAAAGLIVALAVACAADPVTPSASPERASTQPSGGVLRIVMPPEGGSRLAVPAPPPGDPEPDPRLGYLDPHVDSWYDAAELFRCCLGRMLLSTNGRSVEEGGAELRPDLAAEMPTVSADGLTWTFRLRQGVEWGPPLNGVEVTAGDFVRSFHRMLAPDLAGLSFGDFLFGDVVGVLDYQAGRAASITGLETPDRHTLVIRLRGPVGDLGQRLAMGLAMPLPPHPVDPGAAFGTAEGHMLRRPDDGGSPAIGTYGRFLVSSGPYMLEGSDRLDFSQPAAAQVPASGFVTGESVALVRNPNWVAADDPLRPARPDRIELRAVRTVEDAVAELDAGRADLVLNATQAPTIPPGIVAEFQRDPGRGSVHIHEFGAIRGLVMNLAQPPFDDIHVRKAMSLVIDKRRLIELHGGPLAFRVADHMAPDSVLNNVLVDYAPYATPGGAGDLASARAEMALSRYDRDGDGSCDDPACSGVRMTSRDPYGELAKVVAENASAIGIELDVAVLGPEFFEALEDPSRHDAVIGPLGWVRTILAPSEFFVPYTSAPANGSLVASTDEQLETWGYETRGLPSVLDRYEACLPLSGSRQFDCWAALDQHLMENVVPLVPYGSELFVVLAGPRVAAYAFDELVAAPAFDQIALRP